jgi:hypothetical protein
MAIIPANMVGVGMYLWFSVPLWAPSELANIPGAGAGDPIVWGLSALPTLAFFLLLNLVWLAWGGVARIIHCSWPVRALYLAIPAIWAMALYVDFSHHWAM